MTRVRMEAALFLALLAGARPDAVGAGAWPANAVGRFSLARQAATPWPAEAGYVEICPGLLSPTSCAVRVAASNGAAIPAAILWAAEGEPLKIWFDTSGHQEAYELYIGSGPAPPAAPGWQPRAGLVFESRACADPAITNLAQMQSAWDRAAPVLGRSLAPRIFDGLHRHGSSAQPYLGRYRGWFAATGGGDAAFATLSHDASFLLVDGRPVAEWPGRHDVQGELHGEHHGSLRLDPGLHAIDYYLVRPAPYAVAAAAWNIPPAPGFEIIPASAFAPVAAFQAASFAPAPGRPPAPAFEWRMLEHAAAGDATLVTAEFRAIPPGTDRTWICRWTFDDGTARTGAVVRHVFLRPGLRPVRLELSGGDRPGGTLTQNVRLHPQWLQAEECPRPVADRQRAELMTRDLMALPADDLRAAVFFAHADQERAWLAQLGAGCLRRRADFGPGDAGLFFLLADNFEHPEVRDLDRAEDAYRLLLALPPPHAVPVARAVLRWADLLIHGLGRADEAAACLAALDPDRLNADDNRRRRIYQADILLAQGRETQARDSYLRIIGAAGDPEPIRSVKESAQLELARSYLASREFDAAARVLLDIEWKSPARRLSPQTGFPLIETYLGRKEYRRALARCRLLANARLAGNDLARLLFLTAQAHDALGQAEAAARARRQLLAEFPNTELAARVKETMKQQP